MRGAEPADPATVPAAVMARWIVDTSGPAVFRYYLDALPAAGFDVRKALPGGTVAILRFETPDGMMLDLVLVGEGNGSRRTRIDLVVPEWP